MGTVVSNFVSKREQTSKVQQQVKQSKLSLADAEETGIIDPRILLGNKCSPELAELSDAVLLCNLSTKWVCMKLSIEHSRDVERHAARNIAATSNSAVMKDRIEVLKNVTHNVVQAVLWGDQADFVSATRHRTVPDSLQFKLNYSGALMRNKLKNRHYHLSAASRMTSQQTPPSANGHFPTCIHYWWKSVDLLTLILNHIPLRQLGTVSLVHSVWYVASKKVAHVTLTHPIPGDRLMEAQRYFHNPSSLHIISMYNVYPGVWFSVLSYASQNYKHLTTLILKDCSSIVDQDLVPICEHCVSLQSLSLLSLAGLVHPKMTSITLETLIVEDCAWFEEIGGFIPSIIHVSLVRLNCLLGSGFDRTCILLGIIDANNSESCLQSFMLKQCNGVTNLMVKNRNVQTIRVLSCGSLWKCTILAHKATLLTITQCLVLTSIDVDAPLLDRIVIQDMKNLTNAEIMCPTAGHITFQDIHNTTNSVLQRAVRNFQSLNSCRMVNIASANRFPFDSDFRSFSTINSLFIANCAFDDSALSVLVQFDNLKRFELWDCNSLACPVFHFHRSLKSFSCNHCQNVLLFEIRAPGLTEFVISQCHILKELNILSAKLSNVTINVCDKISIFNLESDALTELDLDKIYALDTFSCKVPALQKVSIKHAHEPPMLSTMQALFKNNNIISITLDDLSGFSSFERYQHQQEWRILRELNLHNLALNDGACVFISKLLGLVRLSIRHCNEFHHIALDGMPELRTLDIDGSLHLFDIAINAPKIKGFYIQNCPHLLCATLSGRALETVSFRNSDSIFDLKTVHGCPALKTITFSKAFDIRVICQVFCDTPQLLVQLCNQTHIVKMGELQMRNISEGEK